jgi:hypothetical protein
MGIPGSPGTPQERGKNAKTALLPFKKKTPTTAVFVTPLASKAISTDH